MNFEVILFHFYNNILYFIVYKGFGLIICSYICEQTKFVIKKVGEKSPNKKYRRNFLLLLHRIRYQVCTDPAPLEACQVCNLLHQLDF